jgi:hypothetical protein
VRESGYRLPARKYDDASKSPSSPRFSFEKITDRGLNGKFVGLEGVGRLLFVSVHSLHASYTLTFEGCQFQGRNSSRRLAG